MTFMQPSLSFDFTRALLYPRITFTRAGATATRVNGSGYIETIAADTTRFDYDPVTLVCRGLLVEESRTNLLTYSEDFTNVIWTKTSGGIGANPTIIANTTVAPDGTTTADTYTQSTSSNARLFQTVTAVSGTVYTHSIYVKKNVGQWLRVLPLDTATQNNGFNAYFDLNNGIVGTTGTLGTGAVFTSATITSATNGFWRITISGSIAATSIQALFCYVAQADNNTARLNNGSVFIWGAQLEAGSFPTSYIPTTSASLTRNADVATITGTNFSGFWRSGPGSILVRALPSTVSGTRPLVQVDDASADNIIALRGNATDPELYIRAGGSDQATIDAGTISAAAYRLAGAWQAGSAAAALNSNLAVNGAPGSIPAVTQMRLGSDGTNYLNGHLQAVEYWPVRLGNAGLQTASSTAGYGGILAPVMQDAMLYPQINRSFGL